MLAFGGGSRTMYWKELCNGCNECILPQILRLLEIKLADPKEELNFDNP